VTAPDPSVSIVLPTFNGARYVRESIDSCLGQTHTDLELIVVDDGSTDETPRILSAYTDPRMTVVRQAQNRGLPEALNAGFQRSRGEYLTWTSDDNRFAAEAIAEMQRALDDQPDVGLVYAGYWIIDATGRITGARDVEPPESLSDHDCVGYCFLYRRSVQEVIGWYNPEARLAEDYEYWLRIAQRFRLARIEKRLYYGRRHPASLTDRLGWFPAARAAEHVKLRLGLIDAHQHRTALASIDICEAFENHRAGRLTRVRRCVLSGVRKDPSHLRNRGVLSILLESLIGTTLRESLRRVTGRPPGVTNATSERRHPGP